MGNPHPTRSKPCKVGRKHTNAPSIRVIGRRKSQRLKNEKLNVLKFKEFKKAVATYWRGETDVFPAKPTKKDNL